PKCLLAELAFLTIETSLTSSVRFCESRTSSRIRNADEPARIASSRTDRKISLRRIEKFGINRGSQRPLATRRKRGPFTPTVEPVNPLPMAEAGSTVTDVQVSTFAEHHHIVGEPAKGCHTGVKLCEETN